MFDNKISIVNKRITWMNIFQVDLNVLVSVNATLLVPETDSVHQLMYHGAFGDTNIIENNILFSAHSTNGAAAFRTERKNRKSRNNYKFVLIIKV